MNITQNTGFVGGVSVSYKHICGHQSFNMYYSSEGYAKHDRLRMETDKCWDCKNSEAVAKSQHLKQLHNKDKKE